MHSAAVHSESLLSRQQLPGLFCHAKLVVNDPSAVCTYYLEKLSLRLIVLPFMGNAFANKHLLPGNCA